MELENSVPLFFPTFVFPSSPTFQYQLDQILVSSSDYRMVITTNLPAKRMVNDLEVIIQRSMLQKDALQLVQCGVV
jgi:hypothetical protein